MYQCPITYVYSVPSFLWLVPNFESIDALARHGRQLLLNDYHNTKVFAVTGWSEDQEVSHNENIYFFFHFVCVFVLFSFSAGNKKN